MTDADRKLAKSYEELNDTLQLMKTIIEDITDNLNQTRQNLYTHVINKKYERTH